MSTRLKRTIATSLAALLLASSIPYQTWAAVSLSDAPGAAVSPAALPVAGSIVGSLNAFSADPAASLSGVLSVENQIKAALVLQQAYGVSAKDAAHAIAAPAPQSALARGAGATATPASRAEAAATLTELNAILKGQNWHALHEPGAVDHVLALLSERLAARGQATPASGPAALESVRAAIGLLRPPLGAYESSAAVSNPWEGIFDGTMARLAAAGTVSVDNAKLVPRTAPHWHDVALEIMTAGSMNLSRTALVGRRFFAPKALGHQEIQDLASHNFRSTTEYILDHADELPLNIQTVISINRMLTEGLVDESIRANPYYHGDARFHEEERLFYEWLGSPKATAFASAHPVEMAERLHYMISFLDAFPDSNGRTARLMADLVLVKAGMAPAFYMDIEDYFTRGSVRSGVSLQDRLDYFREMVERGQATMSYRESILRQLDNPTVNLSRSVLQHITGTDGHEGAPIVPEPRGSAVEFLKFLEARAGQDRAPLLSVPGAERPSLLGKLRNIRAGLSNLPSSFKNYVAGSAISVAVSVGVAMTMSVWGITKFGLLWGVVAQGLSLVTRIPASLFGAKHVAKFDAKKITLLATVIQGAQLLSLFAAATIFGPSSTGLLTVFLVGQAVYGAVWGANVMADSKLMRQIIGPDHKSLETAGFVFTASRELMSLATAFVLGPLMLLGLGADKAILVYSGVILSTLPFFAKIKFSAEDAALRDSLLPAAAEAPKAESLPKREYIPFSAATFANVTFYTLFSGVFALFTFHDEHMGPKAISFYVAGRCFVSLLSALTRLGGAGAPGAKRGLMDRLSPQVWFGLLTAVAASYLVIGAVGLPMLGLAASGALGVVTAANQVQWMARYQSQLDPKKLAGVAAGLTSAGVAAALVPFALVSAGKLLGIAVAPILYATVAASVLALAVAWLVARRGKTPPSPRA